MHAVERKLILMINKDKTLKLNLIVIGDILQLESILRSHLIINKCM